MKKKLLPLFICAAITTIFGQNKTSCLDYASCSYIVPGFPDKKIAIPCTNLPKSQSQTDTTFCNHFIFVICFSNITLDIPTFEKCNFSPNDFDKDSLTLKETFTNQCISKKTLQLKLNIPIYLNGMKLMKSNEATILSTVIKNKSIKFIKRFSAPSRLEIKTD